MAFTTATPEVLEVVQFGIESVSGTPVPGNLQFNTLMFDVDPKIPTTEARQAGNLYPTDVVVGKDHTEASAKGDASVQDLIYLFASMLSIPSFSISGAGHLATYAPASLASNPIKTLTLEKGQQGANAANRFPFGFFNDLEIDFVPDKQVSMTAKMMGQTYETGTTLTASPTVLAQSILFPKLIDVFIATTVGGLGAGQIDPLSCKFKMSKTRGDVYALKSADTSFSDVVETAPALDIELVLKKGAQSNTVLAALAASTQYYIQIYAQGVTLPASTDRNFLRITMPIKFTNPGEGAAQEVHTATFNATAVHDPLFNTVGGAILVECRSSLAAL